MLVPQRFAQRMRHGDPDDPLLRQVMPDAAENNSPPEFLKDPVGDLPASPQPGLVHKYQGRVLLVTTGACAVHCRYCFRRHFPYADENAGRDRWRNAIAYIRRQPGIREVILSGGDPLLLATRRLSRLTRQLEPIAHVRTLRIHTRVPIVLESRINRNLLSWLRELPWRKLIVVHANHERELDERVGGRLAALRDSGAILLNQSVLLRGVNDNADTLIRLSERLFDYGVLPYYLHLLDPVEGAAHFTVANENIRNIIHELRVQLPGYLIPRPVREKAGAAYKIPLI